MSTTTVAGRRKLVLRSRPCPRVLTVPTFILNGIAPHLGTDDCRARMASGVAESSAVGARIAGMPLCAYFSAADDQAAVAVLQTPGGPEQAGLDAVFLKNIDPVVAVARLEAVMSGCSFEEASGVREAAYPMGARLGRAATS